MCFAHSGRTTAREARILGPSSVLTLGGSLRKRPRKNRRKHEILSVLWDKNLKANGQPDSRPAMERSVLGDGGGGANLASGQIGQFFYVISY